MRHTMPGTPFRFYLMLFLICAALCIVVVLAAPAQAHGRCDHRDHTHLRFRAWPPSVTEERWTYVRTNPIGLPQDLRFIDTWDVDGRTVLVRSDQCGR